jgi:hypothetical protein
MTMDLSWYPQTVSTLSSGISHEQFSAQNGLQAAVCGVKWHVHNSTR